MSDALAAPPRYAALARDLAEEIARGLHPVGSRLPTEIELSAERGVSRATVRAALERLEELGLVSRRRRTGTLVTAARPDGRLGGGYVQSLSGVEDLLQYAAETERRVLRLSPVVADDALAARLGVRPGSRWLRVSSLRVPLANGGEPLCWTDTYADAGAAPPDLAKRLRAGGPQPLVAAMLAERSGRPIAEIVQRIVAAGVPGGEVARALGAEPGGHALEITRRYLDPAGAALAVSVSLHPAGRFAYTVRLRRRGAGPAAD